MAARRVEVRIGLRLGNAHPGSGGRQLVRLGHSLGVEIGEAGARRAHPQRFEHLAAHHGLPAVSVGGIEGQAEDVVPEIAILERMAGLGRSVVGEEPYQQIGGEVAGERGSEDDGASLLDAVGHRQELLDGDRVGSQRGAQLEMWQVAGDRRAEIELTPRRLEDDRRRGEVSAFVLEAM